MVNKKNNIEKPIVVDKKPKDRWSSIENGEAKSAAVSYYKEPSKEPKFIHPAKLAKEKKLFDGSIDISERIASHGVVKGGTKRKHRETSPKMEPKKSKNVLVDAVKPNKHQHKRLETTVRSAVSQSTYIVEDPDDEEVTVVTNGTEATFKKVVVEEDDSDNEEIDEDEEEQEDEDEIEIEESDMRILPEDIAEYIEDEELEGEDEEEVEDEEGVDDEEVENDGVGEEVSDEEELEDEDEENEEEDNESTVSSMEAESDDEGFIAGKDREAHIIRKEKKDRGVLHLAKAVDFDKFPFTDKDSVVSASRAFAFIISPCDVQTFFDKFYQSNVLVVHRKQPKYYGNLFSTARLCELLERNNLEYGVNINIAQYQNGQRTTLNGKGRVYPQIVKQHLNNACSVQLVNPQTFDDRIWYICEVLQEQFGCFVGANTYLTPAGSSGFAPHWDEIDAFLLQVEGRKYWRVWAPETPDDELPLESSDNFTEDDMKGREPVFEGWIETGDMIYIPRGFIHQARTDDNVHSLHVTVSTGRKWSYADLMEKVIPDAVGALTTHRLKMRKGLPIGLLDMGGVIDVNYSQEEHFTEKFKIVLDRHMSMMRNFVADFLMESSVDSMAKEFFKQALPPLLTETEKKYSVLGSSVNLLGDDLIDFTAKTKVRLIRKHTQRLLMETEDSVFISHRMNNSRLFEGRPEEIVDFPMYGVNVYKLLSNAYPEWRTLEEIFSSKDTRENSRKEKLDSIHLLFKVGVLLVKN